MKAEPSSGVRIGVVGRFEDRFGLDCVGGNEKCGTHESYIRDRILDHTLTHPGAVKFVRVAFGDGPLRVRGQEHLHERRFGFPRLSWYNLK